MIHGVLFRLVGLAPWHPPMSKHADAVTVVIPVHNVGDRLDKMVPAWGLVLEKTGRDFEILVVDDGSTDATPTAAEKLPARVRSVRVLRHEKRQGFGACLQTALAEAKHPLFFYTALDYPYTPSDIRVLFERIDLRDDFMGKQPDLVSGCRTGTPTPAIPKWAGKVWRGFWRVFAGMPIQEAAPWHGWREFWYKTRVNWIYGVPLADVSSCFKLFRTAFLQRFPIQSDGDFVHTELVAKATFLTSIMDEVPLTPKPDPVPALGDISAGNVAGVSVSRVRVRPARTPAPGEPPASTRPETSPPEGPAHTPGDPAYPTAPRLIRRPPLYHDGCPATFPVRYGEARRAGLAARAG